MNTKILTLTFFFLFQPFAHSRILLCSFFSNLILSWGCAFCIKERERVKLFHCWLRSISCVYFGFIQLIKNKQLLPDLEEKKTGCGKSN